MTESLQEIERLVNEALPYPNTYAEALLSAITRVVQEQRDPNILGADLSSAWSRYVALFGQPPHGTIEQMKALCELLPKRAALSTAEG